jgi:hypothetical protein
VIRDYCKFGKSDFSFLPIQSLTIIIHYDITLVTKNWLRAQVLAISGISRGQVSIGISFDESVNTTAYSLANSGSILTDLTYKMRTCAIYSKNVAWPEREEI